MQHSRKKIDKRIPRKEDLILPTFLALKKLGGSGKNEEILEQIIKDLSLSDDVVDILHKDNPNKTELSYQADWARTYLRHYGVIENSARSVWAIKPDFISCETLDVKEVIHVVRDIFSSQKTKVKVVSSFAEKNNNSDNVESYEITIDTWRDELALILQQMDPYSFERLAQRILRECGFSQVEVTKKSNDGGIDGTGRLKINGIFSFNVAFQCKRYKGAVGAPEIRDFRGSLTTNIEKGVLITTGTFTQAAREEASCPGKQQIDLIDGEELISKIAEFGIGVKPITTYEVDKEYFNKI